jgi:hypothetical protein
MTRGEGEHRSEERRGGARQSFDAALAKELRGLRRGFWAAPLATMLATAPIVYGAWEMLDRFEMRPVLSHELKPVTTAIADIQRYQALQRWQMLNMRRITNGGLSTEDQVEYCAISATLGLQGVGCA